MRCPLNAMQLEAVKLYSEGKTAKVASHEMGCSVNSVNDHLKIARIKCGVRTTTGLVAIALRNGWIE